MASENSVWNGHCACTCYRPLFVFNQFGDLERCALRPGNVHSADDWGDVLKPVVVRCQDKVLRIYLRADAAFAMPGVYEYLEAERIKYAISIPIPLLASRSFEKVRPLNRGALARKCHETSLRRVCDRKRCDLAGRLWRTGFFLDNAKFSVEVTKLPFRCATIECAEFGIDQF
jgi:hypothetical protein